MVILIYRQELVDDCALFCQQPFGPLAIRVHLLPLNQTEIGIL